MKGTFPIDKFRELRTPFYYYDTKVLRDTLTCIRTEASRYDNYSVHYAVKANANSKVLTIIRESGLGADCVSGGEIRPFAGKFIVLADGSKVEGTMANNGEISKTIDGLTQTSATIPAGYTSGGTVSLTDAIETALAAI